MDKIIATFEKILDSQPKKTEKQKTKPFESSQDPSLIKGLSYGLPEDHTDKLVVVFSKLSLFFDAGIYLENTDHQWRSVAYFHEGQVFSLNSEQCHTLKVPHTSLFSVLACKSNSVLKSLHLEKLDPENKSQCLLVKPTNDCAYLLFSKLPDLWLKSHIEKVIKEIQNSFT